jgi:hypothetical protein
VAGYRQAMLIFALACGLALIATIGMRGARSVK